ncbi:MAG: sialate O-acetylesterase [Akkermansiaceae bacterium]|tara:strand:- start:456 stop:1712 length:1257 start_codon:yes stop_codon:yes gene_type:complete
MMTRKQTQLLLQLTAAFLLVLGVQARTWTSADGTKTFKGELQSYDAKKGKVTVTLPNGKRQTFSQDRLSEPDITFAKENGRKASGSSSSGGDIKELPDELPDPDGKEADMSKPVQVYILMGQSNMLGAGRVSGGNEGALENACKNKKLYPYLIDDAGNWTARKDVRNVRVNGRTMKVHNNDWLTLKGANIGPEIGIGHYLGHAVTAPVLVLKSCTGNRSLGWDLLPPGSKQYEFEGRIYAGYKESPESWAKGTAPKPIGWYAGLQYDDDIRNAKAVLADLKTYYPGATKYEVAGFFWWQGDKDFRNKAHASKYEENLIALLASLRKDFNAPEAKMVIATLGQTKKDAGGTHGQIINAMFNVAGESGKYPENKNKVATVYSHPLSKGGSSSGHYSGHAETYQNVGEAMGKAMVEMLQSK